MVSDICIIHVHIHIYMYTCIHIYIYTYIYNINECIYVYVYVCRSCGLVWQAARDVAALLERLVKVYDQVHRGPNPVWFLKFWAHTVEYDPLIERQLASRN